MMDVVYYLNAILAGIARCGVGVAVFSRQKTPFARTYSLVQRRNCRIDDRAGVRQVEKAQTTPWNGSSFTSRRVNADEQRYGGIRFSV